ncbi:tubulin polyglutamylase ttll7 [Plakobranchus ocellatus]|uniref:Tubulin polyglutamylase ttll7 n=1 Tax=Plakobranchus ocellatus TaxID=259542 RepID=A0AAV3YQ89_9GAST|nr:tubulin polyglutamylase ttll7 [Plakobranchus ocellatus]
MKNSTSLTSLSSMDKDLSLTSLTQYGRAAAMQRSALSNPPSARHASETREDQQPPQIRLHQQEPMEKGSLAPTLGKKKRRKGRERITANLSGTRYEVVRQMVEKMGFSVTKDDDPTSYLIWNDCFVSPDKISELKPYQRINHFPGMGEVTRKDALARNYLKMQKALPDEFNFMPRTWILPADYSLLINHAKEMKTKKKAKTFIVKPSNGAQGHGISLYRNAEKIPQSEHFIVQEYIDKPLLLDGFKFDLRIYVLITSCDPLRIFLFNDGLVRLATEKYLPPHESNINHLYMHLTNYSVNKHNEYYEKNMTIDTGSKRSIRYFNEYLRRSDIDVTMLWRNIADMIVRTLLVAQPHVLHAYRMCRPGVPSGNDSVCFEVLGFDIMIDRKLRPWLLEINRSPSFGTDERLDFEIKSSLIEDTFKLLNIKVSDKRRNIAAQKAEAQRRLFRTNRKSDSQDAMAVDKKKASMDKRKEELKDLLARVRKMALREDFEIRNCGRFKRIFPSDDRTRQDRYCKIMSSAFSVFLAGRGTSMQREIQVNYNNKYKEEQLLDMIAECEADERDSKLYPGGKPPKGPKPLQSMPESLPSVPPNNYYEDEEEMEYDSDGSPPGSPPRPQLYARHRSASGSRSRAHSRISGDSGGQGDRADSSHSRPGSALTFGSSNRIGGPRPLSQSTLNGIGGVVGGHRSRSITRAATTNKLTALQRSNVDDNFLNSMVKEREEELTKKTLTSLNEMRIKFPGKSDMEAEYLLDQLHENWKFHKPRIASYWLVKLDSIKRRKVVDIVRSNVRAMLQRIWRSSDIDNLRLFRIFSRVFNRLLWSHGQGLWNSFSPTSNTWETIFSKSSENISQAEMDCCRRIVQLCKDCLLIVYKFADEAKNPTSQVGGEQQQQQQQQQFNEQDSVQKNQPQQPAVPPPFENKQAQNGYLAGRDLRPPVNWNPHMSYSQRYARIYQHPNMSSS